jgi:hypothetical protein
LQTDGFFDHSSIEVEVPATVAIVGTCDSNFTLPEQQQELQVEAVEEHQHKTSRLATA